MKLNENIKLLPETGVSIKKRVADFLNRAPDTTLIRLDQNLMNMPLPPKVTEEMKAAVDEVAAPFGVRLSSPWSGYESLKKAIVKHLGERGVQIPESDVFITSGLESARVPWPAFRQRQQRFTAGSLRAQFAGAPPPPGARRFLRPRHP